MRLENWSVCYKDENPYQPPELQAKALQGNVYGHPTFPEGAGIITSELHSVVDGKIRTRSGSIYELGEVNPDYEKAYPNAKHRLLTGFKRR